MLRSIAKHCVSKHVAALSFERRSPRMRAERLPDISDRQLDL
jgi:hypothetical protein